MGFWFQKRHRPLWPALLSARVTNFEGLLIAILVIANYDSDMDINSWINRHADHLSEWCAHLATLDWN